MDRPIGIILTSVDDASTAKKLARGLIEAGIAACVQVSAAGTSFYQWDNAVQEDAEYYLSIKAPPDRRNEIIEWLARQHPYEVPEIVVLEGHAAIAYAQWVSSTCQAP